MSLAFVSLVAAPSVFLPFGRSCLVGVDLLLSPLHTPHPTSLQYNVLCVSVFFFLLLKPCLDLVPMNSQFVLSSFFPCWDIRFIGCQIQDVHLHDSPAVAASASQVNDACYAKALPFVVFSLEELCCALDQARCWSCLQRAFVQNSGSRAAGR